MFNNGAFKPRNCYNYVETWHYIEECFYWKRNQKFEQAHVAFCDIKCCMFLMLCGPYFVALRCMLHEFSL